MNNQNQTVRIDDCECVYCGRVFNGKKACNADMDCQAVTCPECGRAMDVFISVEYTCTATED